MLFNRFVICNFPQRRKNRRSRFRSRYAGPVLAVLPTPSPTSRATGSWLPRAKTCGHAQSRPYVPLSRHHTPASNGWKTYWRKRTKWRVSLVKISWTTGRSAENKTPKQSTPDKPWAQCPLTTRTQPHKTSVFSSGKRQHRANCLISRVEAISLSSGHLIYAIRGLNLTQDVRSGTIKNINKKHINAKTCLLSQIIYYQNHNFHDCTNTLSLVKSNAPLVLNFWALYSTVIKQWCFISSKSLFSPKYKCLIGHLSPF